MSLVSAKAKREERASLWKQNDDLLARAKQEQRELTTEEVTEFDRRDGQITTLLREIERLEAHERTGQDLQETRGRRTTTTVSEGGDDAATQYRTALDAYLRHGMQGLTDEQRATLRRGFRPGTEGAEQRAQTVTTSGGGYAIAQGFLPSLEKALKQFGGMLSDTIVTVLPTATGAKLMLPSMNDVSNKGRLLGINTAVTVTDLAFGNMELDAYKYSSDAVLAPVELLQDTEFDLDPLIGGALGERLGRIVNEHLTTGTGSSQPNGIVTASTLGKTGLTGQTTSIIVDDLVDLEHAVDPAYRLGAAFMFHDSTLKAIKKLKDGEGRPLWLPGIAVREPDTILGYRYHINQDMPVMAASAKSVLFGDLKKYYTRMVKDITIIRLEERYMDNFQVGFLGFARVDGDLRDAGSNPVKHYANSAT